MSELRVRRAAINNTALIKRKGEYEWRCNIENFQIFFVFDRPIWGTGPAVQGNASATCEAKHLAEEV